VGNFIAGVFDGFDVLYLLYDAGIVLQHLRECHSAQNYVFRLLLEENKEIRSLRHKPLQETRHVSAPAIVAVDSLVRPLPLGNDKERTFYLTSSKSPGFHEPSNAPSLVKLLPVLGAVPKTPRNIRL
jgi:hypothetical protein